MGMAGAAAGGEKLRYDVPTGWIPGQLDISRGGITVRRAAAFEVREGNQTAEITATRLPAGAMLAQINRWRGQIGMSEMTAAELDQTKQTIDFAGEPADYVQFVGEREAISGVLAVRGDMAWFIKLQGPVELAARERQHFEEFVRSIRVE
jgi:hypothetical protein